MPTGWNNQFSPPEGADHTWALDDLDFCDLFTTVSVDMFVQLANGDCNSPSDVTRMSESILVALACLAHLFYCGLVQKTSRCAMQAGIGFTCSYL